MSKLKNKIIQLKIDRLAEVKDDQILSKVEKLKIFHNENLMQVNEWISHPFSEYINIFKNLEKTLDKTVIIDDWIGMNADKCHRGQQISYAELVSEIIEQVENIKKTMADTEITTMTIPIVSVRGKWNYSSSPSKKENTSLIEIPVEEAIDHLYNYAIENNESGFTFDW